MHFMEREKQEAALEKGPEKKEADFWRNSEQVSFRICKPWMTTGPRTLTQATSR